MTAAKSPAPLSAPTSRAAPARAPGGSAVRFGGMTRRRGKRIVLYGPGGIGKTTLAATAPGPVAFFDLDESLPELADRLEGLDLRVVEGATTWRELRAALQGGGWDDIATIVIDTATRAEELALVHTLETVKHEKGHKVERIEDYGYGKGYTHLFDTFLTLLGDLDQHAAAGRNVILICHDCVSTVPNPQGEDYQRYEPRLSSPASGKSSVRLRVREWADHLLFIGYDLNVKDGKAKGSGTRTVYPVELPHCMAKSRRLDAPLPLAKYDLALWNQLFALEEGKES